MQQANNFIVLNIREYLENDEGRLGEDKLLHFLSEFSCPLNPDVRLRCGAFFETTVNRIC